MATRTTKFKAYDGESIDLYSTDNAKRISILSDSTGFKINVGGTTDTNLITVNNDSTGISIPAGNIAFGANTILKGTGSSSISLGSSGDTVNLNVSGVIYNVGTLTGAATFSNTVNINGLLTLKGQADMGSTAYGLPADTALSIEHVTAGGSSSIYFKSAQNSPSDFAYIRYQDTTGAAGTELGQLTIGIEDNGSAPDQIMLKAYTIINSDQSSSDYTRIATFQSASADKAYIDTSGDYFKGSTKVSYEGHTHGYLPLAGGTMTDSNSHILMNSASIKDIGNLAFKAYGPGHGLDWVNGNGWKIYESDNSLTTDSKGNLQIVKGTTRVATINTTGQIEIPLADGTAPMVITSKTMVANFNAQYLGGNLASAFATSTHNHDTAYVIKTGDEMTGDLKLKIKDLMFSRASGYGTFRDAGYIRTIGHLLGRQLLQNTDFLSAATTGFGVYDNNSTGRVALSIVSDATSPNSSGKVMRVTYDPSKSATATAPGFGGFVYGSMPVSNDAQPTGFKQYKKGNRIIHSVWAKIPATRTLTWASNSYGTEGTIDMITDMSGTGDWKLYQAIQVIGVTGTFSGSGHWYITGGTDALFTWDVAQVNSIDVDAPLTVDRANSLNVGFKAGQDLSWGDIYATGNVSLEKSLTVGVNAYFANGTTYKIDSNGDAVIRSQELKGNGTYGLKVPTGDSSKSIYIDDYTGIGLKATSNHTWLRNEAGLWSFQSGNAADSWDKTLQIYAPTISTANNDDAVFEIGQRTVSGTNTKGSYKGVKIVHYTGSAIANGYLEAGNVKFTGTIQLSAGSSTVNEFSTDSTFADNSDAAVPTEKAIKTYVDTQVATKDNYGKWILKTNTDIGINIDSGDIVDFKASGGASVSRSDNGTTSTITVSSTDEKVKVDSGATADYIGANYNDGAIRIDNGGLDWADGGNYITISHKDTSSQTSVDNSNGTVIQDVTLDTYGHVTGLASTDLDQRYYLKGTVDTEIQKVNDYTKAQFTLSGGGTITWKTVTSVNYLKWTSRFIATPVDKDQSTDGYIDINMPANATIIAGMGTTSSATVTADGIPIGTWQSIWAIHTIDGDHTSVTLKIASYNTLASGDIPANAILIASVNTDDNTIKLGTGEILPLGGTITNHKWSPDKITNTAVTLSDTQTLTNKTLTSARVSDKLLDTNGKDMLIFSATLNAVNNITVQNATSGSGPYIMATGSDTNIPLNISAKGTSSINLSAGTVFASCQSMTIRASSGNTGLEIGQIAAVETPFIDFHSSGYNIDYDARIISNGGGGTDHATAGKADLTVTANSITLPSTIVSAFKLGSSTTAGFVLTADASGNGTWAALPADKYLSAVSGSANGTATFTVTNGSNISWTTTHTHTKSDITDFGTYDNYVSWNVKGGSTDTALAVKSNDTITFVGSGATTVSRSSGTITISSTDTNTDTATTGVDDILQATNNGFTIKYAPFPVANKSAGRLYSGTTDPTNNTRLNYDGYFYATKVYVGSAEVALKSDIPTIPADKYLSAVSGSGNGSVTFTVTNGTNITWDASHTHSQYLTVDNNNYVTGASFASSILTLNRGGTSALTDITVDLTHTHSQYITTDNNNYITGMSGSGNGTVTITRGGTSSLANLTWDSSHTHSQYITTDNNNYLTGVSGSGNGTVTFTRGGTSTLTNLTWDASHNHDAVYLKAEADTLATVTARGATTSTAVTFSGGVTVTGGLTSGGKAVVTTDDTRLVDIKYARISFTTGQSQAVWNHNANWTDYIVQITPSTPEAHVYYTAKTVNSITICLDDAAYGSTDLDVVLTRATAITTSGFTMS